MASGFCRSDLPRGSGSASGQLLALWRSVAFRNCFSVGIDEMAQRPNPSMKPTAPFPRSHDGRRRLEPRCSSGRTAVTVTVPPDTGVLIRARKEVPNSATGYGRGAGLGRGRGDGVSLGVAVGVAVGVGVGVAGHSVILTASMRQPAAETLLSLPMRHRSTMF